MLDTIIYNIKKNPYRLFLAKFIIFLSIVFIIDFTIGSLLNYFYFKQKSGYEYRTTYSLEKTQADVLIFGSSRANHHYRPDIFEDRLNMTYYNVGRDGNFIFYHYAMLKGILERYAPKIIVLDLVKEEFRKNSNSYDRIATLLPYYDSHPEIRSIIELKSHYEKYKLFSKIYPFNSLILKISIANTDFNKKRSPDIKGYIPKTRTWDQPITYDTTDVRYELDNKKIEMYEDFIKDCNKAGIKLYVFVSPYFIKLNHTDYSIAIGGEIAKKYNIKFYDYSNDSLFTSNRSLFDDMVHLNHGGAKVFTDLVVDRILNGN
ncbi:MAG: hypothetical protein ABI760_09840 [Ferruginibacter sp.]